MKYPLIFPAALATLACVGTVHAAGAPTLQEITVSSGQHELTGVADSATEGTVTAKQLANRPLLRPAEALETVPGMIVTQHSGDGKANVVVAYFNRQQQVSVEKGENSGKTISYLHSVNDVQTIGMWDGKPTNFVLPATVLDETRNGGCAVLLQRMKDGETSGPIVGATMLEAAGLDSVSRGPATAARN